MARRRLNEKQLMAVEYLSTPNRAGMTFKEIAEEVGVAEQTLHRWRKDDAFYNAVNKAIIRKSQDRLPDMVDAAIDGVIDEKNAALFRTIMQAHGLLTDKIEVDAGSTAKADVDEMRKKIEEFRKDKTDDKDG